MIRKLAIAFATLAVLGSAQSAFASCPQGTAYNCYTTYNGKQSCGCR